MNKFINIEPNGVRGLERFLDNGSISYEKGNASKSNYTRFEFDDVDDHDFKIIIDYVKKYNIKYNLKEHTQMNKLIETKLRRIIQKEIKSVLKESVGLDTDHIDELNEYADSIDALAKEVIGEQMMELDDDDGRILKLESIQTKLFAASSSIRAAVKVL